MKKIINDDRNCVQEMLEGYLAAYSDLYENCGMDSCVVAKKRRKKGVTLVIGGGSGHEPLFGGFVGSGLADAAVCGNIFAAPNPNIIFQTVQRVHNGNGVLFIYGNYAGDNMNFDVAEELCEIAGIQTAHVRVYDDCASAPIDRMEDRRGIAGDAFVIKIAGAACDAGLPLEEVVRIAEKARDQIRSLGIDTQPGTAPGRKEAMFELGENEIEYGMGLHGEKGIQRTQMAKADELVEYMYTALKADYALKAGDTVCALVNGLGSTTLMELSIVYRKLYELLNAEKIKVHDGEIKSWCTCQDMGGFSITILKLDAELKRFYDEPCHSAYYSKAID